MSLTIIFGFIIISAVLSLLIKQYKPEYSMMINIAAGIIVFMAVLNTVMSRVFEMHNIMQSAGIDTDYFSVLIKAVGICYITGFVADICKDSGQAALEGKVYFAGRCAVFLLSFPLLRSLFDIAVSFL